MSAKHPGPRRKVPTLHKVMMMHAGHAQLKRSLAASLVSMQMGAQGLDNCLDDIDDLAAKSENRLMPYDKKWMKQLRTTIASVQETAELVRELAAVEREWMDR